MLGNASFLRTTIQQIQQKMAFPVSLPNVVCKQDRVVAILPSEILGNVGPQVTMV